MAAGTDQKVIWPGALKGLGGTKMSPKTLALASLSIALALALSGCTAPRSPVGGSGKVSSAPAAEALEVVPMISHVQFGVFEMDVFIERATEPGKVYRPSPGESGTALTKDAPLYATAAETPHDTTFTNAGPFDKGAALGFKLSDWLAASGSAAYLCTGGSTARIDAAFSGLVPNGVYTFWNARLQFTDGKITGGQDLPLGTADGSQNTFQADEKGNGRLSATWTGCNEPSTGGPGIGPDGVARLFAIAYHSDGQTFGGSPGPFGQSTHVQLFGIVKAAPAA